MLTGMQGNVHPHRCGQIAGPHAAAHHHILGFDLALLSGHSGDLLTIMQNGRYCAVLQDLNAVGPSALGQSLGDIHRIGITVAGDVETAQDIVGLYQRDSFLDLLGTDHVDLKAEYLGHGGAALEFLKALDIGR